MVLLKGKRLYFELLEPCQCSVLGYHPAFWSREGYKAFCLFCLFAWSLSGSLHTLARDTLQSFFSWFTTCTIQYVPLLHLFSFETILSFPHPGNLTCSQLLAVLHTVLVLPSWDGKKMWNGLGPWKFYFPEGCFLVPPYQIPTIERMHFYDLLANSPWVSVVETKSLLLSMTMITFALHPYIFFPTPTSLFHPPAFMEWLFLLSSSTLWALAWQARHC